MDTTIMEYTAEDLISHKLQRSGILVAKPKFDNEGADLLAFLGVSDGAKFCRIQCKGRSLINSPSSTIDVPKEYVTDAFTLFLFVETGNPNSTHLFCFFGKDIRETWRCSSDNRSFTLSLSQKKLSDDLARYEFGDNRVSELKKVIINVNVEGEFHKVMYGYGEATLPAIRMSGRGTFIPPSHTKPKSR